MGFKLVVAYSFKAYRTKEDAEEMVFPYILGADGNWIAQSWERLKEQKLRHTAFAQCAGIYTEHSPADIYAQMASIIKDDWIKVYGLPSSKDFAVIEPIFFSDPKSFDESIVKEIESLGLDVEKTFADWNEKVSSWRHSGEKDLSSKLRDMSYSHIIELEEVA